MNITKTKITPILPEVFLQALPLDVDLRDTSPSLLDTYTKCWLKTTIVNSNQLSSVKRVSGIMRTQYKVYNLTVYSGLNSYESVTCVPVNRLNYLIYNKWLQFTSVLLNAVRLSSHQQVAFITYINMYQISNFIHFKTVQKQLSSQNKSPFSSFNTRYL